MIEKRKNKMILAIGSIASPLLVTPIVVSCNEKKESLFSDDWTSEVIKITSPITIYDFINKCSSLDNTRIAFNQYTNFLEIEKNFNNNGIFIKQISNVHSNGSINSIKCRITFTDEKGNNDTEIDYIIIGFIAQDTELDKIIFNFKEKIVPILKAKVSNFETSSEIWNMWWNAKPYERTSLLYSYIEGLPSEILNQGIYSYNGLVADVSIPNSFASEKEAKEKVFWNENVDSNLIKGSQLSITFSFSLRGIDGKMITKDILVELGGFTSFEDKLRYFANSFLNSKGNITINDPSIPTRIICGEFENQSNYDLKLKGLSKYLNNLPNPYVQDDNGVIYKLIDIKQSIKNVNAITLSFEVSWNEIKTDVSFDISSFIGDVEYFNVLKSQLLSLYLSPTQLGSTKSSEEVYKEYQLNPESINKYISGIPESTDFITYKIKNVYWNENESIQVRGSILNMTISLSYANKTSEVNLLPITGFTSPYSKLLNQFDEKCANINLSLNNPSEARKIIVNELTTKNINEYVSGIPISNETENVTSLIIDYSSGIDGIVNISFVFSWKTDIYTFEREIKKSIYGFKRYAELSSENYLSVINNMVKDNYLDLIKKSGVNYSDWLTSYFTYDQTTTQGKIEALLNLWNLPIDLFGVEFKITTLQYSGTNSSLSDTQLLIDFEVKDIYNNRVFSSNQFIVDGFFDPYTNTIRSYVSKSANSELNAGNIQKYTDVNASIQLGDGNSQTSLVSYWLKEPYAFYAGGENDSSKQSKWVSYIKPKAAGILSNANITKASIELNDAKFIWKGNKRYGNNDSKGTCPAPISVKFTYHTKAFDNKGNSAYGKYKSLTTNYLILWFYFQNRYWSG